VAIHINPKIGIKQLAIRLMSGLLNVSVAIPIRMLARPCLRELLTDWLGRCKAKQAEEIHGLRKYFIDNNSRH